MSRPISVLKSSSECLLKSQQRCLRSLDCRRRVDKDGVARVFGARRYAATAAAAAGPSERQGNQQVEYLDDEETDKFSLPTAQRSSGDASILYPKRRPRADPEPLVKHLRSLFPPLDFPDTVATQMMTHISAKEAWAGHNARLAFVGRRVLHTYLLLFLQHSSQKVSQTTSPFIDADRTFDFDRIAYKALFTHLLGEHVGSKWNLARTMLWTPPVRARPRRPDQEGLGSFQEALASLKSPGLYKVQGATVEGIIGGIYHQFGGTIAQRVFHTRLLPHILCPGTSFGLHDAFHPAALDMQARMGGPDGLLVPSEPSLHRTSEPRSQPSALPQTKEHQWKTASEAAQTSRHRVAL